MAGGHVYRVDAVQFGHEKRRAVWLQRFFVREASPRSRGTFAPFGAGSPTETFGSGAARFTITRRMARACGRVLPTTSVTGTEFRAAPANRPGSERADPGRRPRWVEGV